VTVSDGKLR